MKCSPGVSNFLEEISSLSHSIVFLISLHWSMRKAFLSLLAILWNSEFKWIYLSFPPLPLASLLFWAICKALSNIHFAFLRFFSLGMVWSIVLQALYQIWSLESLCHFYCVIVKDFIMIYLNGLVDFPTFFNLSLNLAIRHSWSEPQSAPALVFADCIELLHLWLQRI